MNKISYKSPIGNIVLEEDQGKIVALFWSEKIFRSNIPVLTEAVKQLDEYFNKKREDFFLPLNLQGTDFSKKVWKEIAKIKYGKQKTYKDIAEKLSSHPRAVGMACGKNPIPIIIPCHRVLATSGKLTGYSGGEGVVTKKILLDLEIKK